MNVVAGCHDASSQSIVESTIEVLGPGSPGCSGECQPEQQNPPRDAHRVTNWSHDRPPVEEGGRMATIAAYL